MSRQEASRFVVLAHTTDIRRKIERVERLAIELEQAVKDLNTCDVDVTIVQ